MMGMTRLAPRASASCPCLVAGQCANTTYSQRMAVCRPDTSRSRACFLKRSSGQQSSLVHNDFSVAARKSVCAHAEADQASGTALTEDEEETGKHIGQTLLDAIVHLFFPSSKGYSEDAATHMTFDQDTKFKGTWKLSKRDKARLGRVEAAVMVARGCVDPKASNYSPDAMVDDGSCIYDPDGTGVGAHLEDIIKTEFGVTINKDGVGDLKAEDLTPEQQTRKIAELEKVIASLKDEK